MLSSKVIWDDTYSNKVSKKIARTTTTNILILVLMLLHSAPITVNSPISTSSDPPPSYTTYSEDDRDKVFSPHSDRHHPTKTQSCHRHQGTRSSASTLSRPIWAST